MGGAEACEQRVGGFGGKGPWWLQDGDREPKTCELGGFDGGKPWILRGGPRRIGRDIRGQGNRRHKAPDASAKRAVFSKRNERRALGGEPREAREERGVGQHRRLVPRAGLDGAMGQVEERGLLVR